MPHRWTPHPDTRKSCTRCRQPFVPEAPAQRYCTRTCRIIARHERQLARELARLAEAEEAA